MLKLATAEPYSLNIHGNGPIGKYIVIYDYTLDEFYSDEWKEDISFHTKKTLSHIRKYNIIHEIIRNYPTVIRSSKCMQLVESYTDPIGRELCILHTYKINLFKRKWRSCRC